MRQPSSWAQLFGWWDAAVRGLNPPRHDGIAECGFYKRKLFKGGPFVPVKIYVEREIDPETGELAEPERLVMDVEGLRSGRDPHADFSWLTPISKEEYDHLADLRLRDSRFFDSSQKIDLSQSPTLPRGGF